MKIKTVNNYYTDENTYIVYDENTKNGLVIDPGYCAAEYPTFPPLVVTLP